MSLRKIIAYNVDFGDCILLVFQENDNKNMLLVDFGTRMKSESESRVKWEKVATKIKEEMQLNNVSKLHFLLTHYHKDHYNGLKEMDGVIDTVYTGIELLEYTKKSTLKDVLGVEAKQRIVTKGKLCLEGTNEEINILWPNKEIRSNCFKSFVLENFPEQKDLLEKESMYEHINTNNYLNETSVVFEAQGVDGEYYFFTGDLFNDFCINGSTKSKRMQSISDVELDKMRGKYTFIKIPHHGIASWPVKEGLLKKDDGKILISWGETGESVSWLSTYKNIPMVFMTNKPDGFEGNVVSKYINKGVEIEVIQT